MGVKHWRKLVQPRTKVAMIRLILGQAALFILAILPGTVLHWAVGVAVIVVPITITYIRLKVSPSYRKAGDQRIEAATADKS